MGNIETCTQSQCQLSGILRFYQNCGWRGMRLTAQAHAGQEAWACLDLCSTALAKPEQEPLACFSPLFGKDPSLIGSECNPDPAAWAVP